MGPYIDGDFNSDVTTDEMYAGVYSSGQNITPIIENMIAGMRGTPIVRDPNIEIDLRWDSRIRGTGDICSETTRILRKLVFRRINPEEAFVLAQKIWNDVVCDQYMIEGIEAGNESFTKNHSMFMEEAHAWWDANPMILTAQRESGDITIQYRDGKGEITSYDVPISNQWVVRNQHGFRIDNSQYRYDMLSRYPGLTIIGD